VDALQGRKQCCTTEKQKKQKKKKKMAQKIKEAITKKKMSITARCKSMNGSQMLLR